MNKSIPPFYVGQRVVCVVSHEEGFFKKGEEFTITEIMLSTCGCIAWRVRIGVIYGNGNGTKCGKCNKLISNNGPLWFKASRFSPVTEAMQPVTFEKIQELNPLSCN